MPTTLSEPAVLTGGLHPTGSTVASAVYHAWPMPGERTTIVVQRYLDAIAGDERAESLVRELLDQAVRRLHLLCANLLRRSYPRLARPPLNLRPEELLSAVVERLLKALCAVKPGNVRQFFGLANQHMRWELNDLARRLDQHPPPQPISDGAAPAPVSTASALSPDTRRMLQAIEDLPEDEREAFSLVRIQGLSQGEVAELLAVSTKTVQRRLNRSLLLLAQALHDLKPVPPGGRDPGQRP
jgi:RNA polymerase sigma-70 factor (ECF subfamily)